MLVFTIRRLVNSVLVLLAASFFVYIFCAWKYDPLAIYRAAQPPKSPAFFAEQRRILKLDRPLVGRYWDWLSNLVRFDFHNVVFFRFNFGSDVSHAAIAPQLATRLEVTSRMILVAIVVAALLAIVFGVISGLRQDKPVDITITILTFVLIALPTFWFAALLKQGAIALNDAAGQRVFFTTGDQSFGIENYGSSGEIRADQFLHLILPTISLALLTASGWIRYQRQSTIEVLDADYLRLARAKGVRWPTVVRRHGVRNALIPLVTIVALDVGALFGGAIITERVYVWHGMGEYLSESLANQDVNAVVGWVMVSAIFVVVFNFLADILYGVLDPRVRLT